MAKITSWIRRNLKVILAALVIIPLLGFACGPIAFFPGLLIGGTSAPAPDDWTPLDSEAESLIEKGSSFPYVVPTNYVATRRGLYVVAVPYSIWRSRIRADPEIRVRIGDSTYELTAHEVPKTDTEQLQFALDSFSAKYAELLETFGTGPLTVETFEYDLLRLDVRK